MRNVFACSALNSTSRSITRVSSLHVHAGVVCLEYIQYIEFSGFINDLWSLACLLSPHYVFIQAIIVAITLLYKELENILNLNVA